MIGLLYHGTADRELATGAKPFALGQPSPLQGPAAPLGIFFSPKRSEAERYSLFAQNDFDAEPIVVAAALHLMRPKVVSFAWLIERLKTASAVDLRREAQAEGHDGFILEHVEHEPAEYVVFDPSQVCVSF